MFPFQPVGLHPISRLRLPDLPHGDWVYIDTDFTSLRLLLYTIFRFVCSSSFFYLFRSRSPIHCLCLRSSLRHALPSRSKKIFLFAVDISIFLFYIDICTFFCLFVGGFAAFFLVAPCFSWGKKGSMADGRCITWWTLMRSVGCA